VRAIEDFRDAGHDVYAAAPLVERAGVVHSSLGIRALLPLHTMRRAEWGKLLLTSYRVAYWARCWQPDLYLSVGAQCATMGHCGRGVVNGYGLSVLVLPALHFEVWNQPGHYLERRAIHECDRLITHDAALAERLIASYGARRADLTLVPGIGSGAYVTLCESYLAEPPGFQ
jgi:hypothetical protein